jgi:hypothetical protein
MSMRVCPVPGCPVLTDSGRCADHLRQKRRDEDKLRPNSAARGYGKDHRQLRKQWSERVAAGTVPCARCGHLIAPGDPWDLGHDDTDRTKYCGPEHASCNRATASRRVT